MKEQKTFMVDILFLLALFVLFTISSLILVSVGAEVYRQTTSDMSTNYDMRTSIAYITEKVRQNDSLIVSEDGSNVSNVTIASLNGKQALVLTQELNSEYYETYLYLHDGHLKELLIKSGTDLGEHTLFAGQNIMELSDLEMKILSDNLLSITLVTPDNQSHEFFISTHCVAN